MSKIKYLSRAFSLSLKIKSRTSLIISVLGLGFAFFPMLIALQMATFTDGVQGLYENQNTWGVLTAFALLVGLYLVRAAFSFAQNYYLGQDSARIRRYVKEKTLHLLTTIPYKYIENQDGFRNRLDLVTQYSADRTAGSISMVFSFISGLISFFSIVFILFAVSPWIVLILVATCIPAALLSLLQQDETYHRRTKWNKDGSMAYHYGTIYRTIHAQKEIRYFGLSDYIKAKWRNLGTKMVAAKMKLIRKHLAYNAAADILRNGVYLFIIIIAAHGIFVNRDQGLGTYMMVVAAAGQLQTITTNLLVQGASIKGDLREIEDFFILMETPAESKTCDKSESGYDKADIEFKNVSFTYPSGHHKALDGLSVKIRQGEKIAIVGANGSGKSTFINLLCGLYPPESGAVHVNDRDIADNLGQLRQSISVIFQHFCHYHDTLRNNITVSDPSRQNDEEIMSLLAKTGADSIINDCENGLDEMVGMFAAKGISLSGGQWQKIAISRALHRKDACVYVLDEPTAALDPISEANIYRNFAELTSDKTTILISHRLGIASIVDRVLVFDKGRIVEDGSHDQLMAQGGIYSEMYQAQAQWYL